MGMCSTSFSNSAILFTSLHYGISGSCHHTSSKNSTVFFVSFPFTKTLLSSSLPPLSRPTHFSSLSVFPNLDSNNLGVSAFKKGRKDGSTLFEMDGSADDDDDEFLDFDGEFDGGDDDDEEGVFLPFGKMKKWLENKPSGFGEGKVYDTSIEDKLLEEIEQSKKAQLVNVSKLKNNPVNSGSKKDDQQDKKDVPSGIRVRVVNLPKKKNVHRDLKAAFDGVSGIINISPAVSGNKKTKDPICKGFAFLDFKHEVDAIKFVQNFSGQGITFGRVQKQIKCEIMNSLSNSPANAEMRDNDCGIAEVAASGLMDSPNVDFVENNSFSDLSLEGVSNEFDDQDYELATVSDEFDDQDDELDTVSNELDEQDDQLDLVELEEDRENFSAIGEPESSSVDDIERALKHSADSTTSERLARIRALEKKLLARGKQLGVPKEQKGQKQERIRGVEKKPPVRGNQRRVTKEKNVQKLEIPGSAKRLKIKEKAVLTGVFSKYGLKTLTTEEES